MSHNVSIFLALCLGQASWGTNSPYTPMYAPSASPPAEVQSQNPPSYVSQPVNSGPATGPLRAWWQNRGNGRGQPGCNCGQGSASPSPMVYTMTPGVTVPTVTATNTPANGFQPLAQGQPAPLPAGVAGHEESEPPTTIQVIPQPAQPAQPVQTPAPVADLQVDKKYEAKIGHEHDYSWVTGHLFYVHADGGKWVIRYGMPGEVDKYGGSIVLAPGVEMKNFREGDLVCVYGDILNENRTSASLGGALYRVNSILMIERGDQ